MRGNEIINELIRTKVPNIEQAHESILNKIENQDNSKKQFSHLLAVKITAVAVVCLVILGCIFLSLQNDNFMTYNTAYAVGLREDGSFELYEIEIADRYETRSGRIVYVIPGDRWQVDDAADIEIPIENGAIPFDLLDSEQQQEIVEMVLELSEVYMPDLSSIEKPLHDDNCKKCDGEVIPFECLSPQEQQQAVNSVLDIILNDKINIP